MAVAAVVVGRRFRSAAVVAEPERLLFPVLVFLFLLQSLCEPDQRAERRQAWSWLGAYMIVGGIIAAIIAGGMYMLRLPMTAS